MRDIGYEQDGFSYDGADVDVLLHGQSPDIAMGVDVGPANLRVADNATLILPLHGELDRLREKWFGEASESSEAALAPAPRAWRPWAMRSTIVPTPCRIRCVPSRWRISDPGLESDSPPPDPAGPVRRRWARRGPLARAN